MTSNFTLINSVFGPDAYKGVQVYATHTFNVYNSTFTSLKNHRHTGIGISFIYGFDLTIKDCKFENLMSGSGAVWAFYGRTNGEYQFQNNTFINVMGK